MSEQSDGSNDGGSDIWGCSGERTTPQLLQLWYVGVVEGGAHECLSVNREWRMKSF